ncbi:MAG: ferrous iron transport protein B, partial [Muribaculaceae bacterium]|nr:ferrous iron transport protein B [Muribaculaceae bacterium]
QYLKKMGGLILVASIIIWALSYFPRYDEKDIPNTFRTETLKEMSPERISELGESKVNDLILNEYQQSHSILGGIGRFVEPVVSPMEFGWKPCVSLIAGSAAKEVVVSTLGVLYVGEDDADLLSNRLKTPSKITEETPFTPQSALSYMVFVLLYFPCIATLAAIARETGSWKYSLFSIVYNTALAWIFAFITFKIAMLF